MATPARELRLRALKEALPPEVEFAEFIRQVMGRAAKRTSVDFKVNIADWIVKCREDGGLPMLRHKYAEKPYPEGHVLGICWSGRGLVEHRWFRNIPEEDRRLIETTRGEWKGLIEKYGTPEQVEKAMRAPVILKPIL